MSSDSAISKSLYLCLSISNSLLNIIIKIMSIT